MSNDLFIISNLKRLSGKNQLQGLLTVEEEIYNQLQGKQPVAGKGQLQGRQTNAKSSGK